MFAWTRIARGLAVCGMLLAGCATDGSQLSGTPLVISPQVATHLERYQHEISSGRSGAFAVNEDGDRAFYSICEHGNCNGQYNFSSQAIQGCERFGHGRCVVLAANGVIKRPYKVGN